MEPLGDNVAGVCKECRSGAKQKSDEARSGFIEDALMKASCLGHLQCLTVILLEGADINTQDENGCTALMKASECGHNKCVKVLIKTGADVDKRNTKGFTALMSASENGHSKCLKLLIEAGANVNKLYQDFTGLTLTALKLASSAGGASKWELVFAEVTLSKVKHAQSE